MLCQDVMGKAVEQIELLAEIYSIGRVSVQYQYKTFPSFQYRFLTPDNVQSFRAEFILNNQGEFTLNGELVKWDKEILLNGNRMILTIGQSDLRKLKKGRYGLEIRTPSQVRGMFGGISIEPIKSKPSFNVSLVSDNAKKASDLIDALLKAYQLYSKEESRNQSINALSFIDDRMSQIEQDLDSVEKKMQRTEKMAKTDPKAKEELEVLQK